MFNKLFKNKNVESKTSIYAPVDGEVIPLEEVPDPVFSGKLMGDGIAIKPANGKVVSPVQGEIIQVFPTKHAIGVRTKNGVEILLHIGLETVNLKGEGFTVFVKEGDLVNVGDKILDFNKEIIEEKASSTITPIIIMNSDKISDIQYSTKNDVTAGKDEILVIEK
ncbi:PTS glucose transporter subunit IIA (plasmid) [Bacillus sp. S3]|uniref:PTS sugar transporter subunit IIA n=1 Tax=Bacillus sp. S3 TaxID=486398 RepID=UPI00118D22D8|nr:PTS glucose transporter subunit IIA [Bacillus sp. S3]QCJ45533.1 PTS glucose transporter subunit IIA [Bacillus sp. S3]